MLRPTPRRIHKPDCDGTAIKEQTLPSFSCGKKVQQVSNILRLSQLTIGVSPIQAFELTKVISNLWSLPVCSRPINTRQDVFEDINVNARSARFSYGIVNTPPIDLNDRNKIGVHTDCLR